MRTGRVPSHDIGHELPSLARPVASDQSQEGGGNFLIDGYEILRQLDEDPETRWVKGAGWQPGLVENGLLIWLVILE